MNQVHFDSFLNIHHPFTRQNFLLNSTPQYGINHVENPSPIIIEKLMPFTEEVQVNSNQIKENMVSSLSSVLSSDKLAMAVQLAKIDIAKLKMMLDPCQAELMKVFTYEKNTDELKKKKEKKIKKQNPISDAKQRFSLSVHADTKSTASRELKPASKKTETRLSTLYKKESEELQLYNELISHAKTLGDVVKSLGAQPHDHSKKDSDGYEEIKKKRIRAEEQIHRLSRMTYMLQKNIQQLEQNLSKVDLDINLAKANKSPENFSFVFRAAIRALRTFVSQAPLYFDTNGFLPTVYKDLGSLIHRLSILSTSNLSQKSDPDSMEIVDNLIGSLELATTQCDSSAKPSSSNKIIFSKPKDDWLKKKAADLQLVKENTYDRENQYSTNEPSKLKSINNPLKSRLSQKLKKKKTKQFATQSTESSRMNFAAPTVVSRIREKQPVEKQSSDYYMRNKEKDNNIVKEAVNKSGFLKSSLVFQEPASSNSVESHTEAPYDKRKMKKRLSIDESQNEFEKSNNILKMTSKGLKDMRNELANKDLLVLNAEEEIKEKLKPLLDKAQAIADEDAKRYEDYKSSVYRRLADVASQKAMSEGERLAEYILDDLLLEAAIDLQRIDLENEAEIDAAFLCDRPNLEVIEQRLHSFEKEEEEIRRHWKTMTYTSLNKNSFSLSTEPIVFTSCNKSTINSQPEFFASSTAKSINFPRGVYENVIFHKERYEEFIQNKKTTNSNGAKILELLDLLSEEILDRLIYDVAQELDENCHRFVEDVYEEEFVH
ncbi:uncharacterized protein LOC101236448 isoform X1 [Hydra vulgaris]|uniref:uncharacterized protein LOC101236448 isoform X1 n=1 Tax=Hydra vulgaris TaxID=6087 RepID=UPI001F5E45BC|nr:uncharacterized protein LOC101236448 isoform X2 [Hydra vulgaris]